MIRPSISQQRELNLGSFLRSSTRLSGESSLMYEKKKKNKSLGKSKRERGRKCGVRGEVGRGRE